MEGSELQVGVLEPQPQLIPLLCKLHRAVEDMFLGKLMAGQMKGKNDTLFDSNTLALIELGELGQIGRWDQRTAGSFHRHMCT